MPYNLKQTFACKRLVVLHSARNWFLVKTKREINRQGFTSQKKNPQ